MSALAVKVAIVLSLVGETNIVVKDNTAALTPQHQVKQCQYLAKGSDVNPYTTLTQYVPLKEKCPRQIKL